MTAAFFTAASLMAAPADAQILQKILRQPKETVPSRVCEDARDVIETDRKLLQAMRSAFGRVAYESTRNANPENCLYPVKFLQFRRFDILVTSANEPGELCNLCTAKVSAHFLRNRPGTPKVQARHINFARIGPTGDPGVVTAIALGASEGMVFETTTEYAGITYKELRVFVFDEKAKKVHELKSDSRIPTSYDNADNVEDKTKLVEAVGSWKLDPRRPRDVIVDYKVTFEGKTTETQVYWTRNGGKLERTGDIPKMLLEEPDMSPGDSEE